MITVLASIPYRLATRRAREHGVIQVRVWLIRSLYQ